MEEPKKRKDTTSTASHNKYNRKTYTRFVLEVKNEKAEAYKQKCKEKEIPFSRPLHEAIDNFLEKE